MKKISLSCLFIILFSIIFAEDMPEWVSYYNKTGTIENHKKNYFGIGISDKSQSEADKTALRNFAMSIETKVKSEVNSYLSEKNGKVKDKIYKKIIISSDIGLKGISITGRYCDGEYYYSIIQYEKKEYNLILREEVERDLERQKIELEKEIEENKIAEIKKQEEIRKKKEKEKIKDSLAEMKNELMLKLRNKYPDFFNSAPPYQAVSFRNGQLTPYQFQINLKAGLFPVSLDEVLLSYKLWLFEFSSTSAFYESKYDQQELQLKFQILPYSGNFYKFSAAFGFKGYKTELIESSFQDAYLLVTPFIAGNITLPDLHFSFASIYADLGKTSFAVNNYLFYNQLKDRFSVIAELDYYYDENLMDKFDDAIVFQPAIRFKTTDNITSTFSYEDNELWKISVELGF